MKSTRNARRRAAKQRHAARLPRRPLEPAKRVRTHGPRAELIVEHTRRLTSMGEPRTPMAQWWFDDARDYALEAPEVLPAGSCVSSVLLDALQRTVIRGEA
jgi:hypothetical protein